MTNQKQALIKKYINQKQAYIKNTVLYNFTRNTIFSIKEKQTLHKKSLQFEIRHQLLSKTRKLFLVS